MGCYNAHLIFMERFLLRQTCFFNQPKVLKSFNVRISRFASCLLCTTTELRYLNLFTWIGARFSNLTRAKQSRKGLVHNVNFLGVNLQPKYLFIFRKTWILVTVCYQQTWDRILDYCWSWTPKLTGTEYFCLQFTLYSSVESVKTSDKSRKGF